MFDQPHISLFKKLRLNLMFVTLHDKDGKPLETIEVVVPRRSLPEGKKDTVIGFENVMEIDLGSHPDAISRLSERALLAEAELHADVEAVYKIRPDRPLAVIGKPPKDSTRLKIGQPVFL